MYNCFTNTKITGSYSFVESGQSWLSINRSNAIPGSFSAIFANNSQFESSWIGIFFWLKVTKKKLNMTKKSYLWSNCSLVLTSQIGLVAVQDTNPALAAEIIWTNGVSGVAKLSLQKFFTCE